MLIPNKFNGYTAGRRTYNTGMEPILIGAALGGVSSAAQGGDPLKGALLGGVTGGIGNAVAPALGTLFSSQLPASAAAPIVEGGIGLNAAANAASQPGLFMQSLLSNPAQGALQAAASTPMQGVIEAATAMPISMGEGITSLPLDTAGLDFGALNAATPTATEQALAQSATDGVRAGTGSNALAGLEGIAPQSTGPAAQTPAANQGIKEWWKSLPTEKKLMYGGAGGLGLMALMGRQGSVPGQAPYTGPLSKFKYDPSRYIPASIPMRMARGGIADLGSYSDGGRLLKGPGDGMSDNIPATISNKRPARLADGEFVVPADVVSHLGNGSTDAGAKQLYSMMDKVRSARTGRKAQGKQIKPQKYMPA